MDHLIAVLKQELRIIEEKYLPESSYILLLLLQMCPRLLQVQMTALKNQRCSPSQFQMITFCAQDHSKRKSKDSKMMLLTLIYILSRLLEQAIFSFPVVLMVKLSFIFISFNEPRRRNV